MEEQNTRARLMPCDIKGFEKIRSGGYVYLDKTEYVYKLAHSGMSYVYLSRPKRFGKSMLLDTLDCYYSGRRSLFDEYDGYLFSYMPGVERVYNPFSLVNALHDMTQPENDAQSPEAYWTGTSGGYALQKWTPELEKMLSKLDKCHINYRKLNTDDITSSNPLLLFYQAGYLTIDHREGDEVYMRIPNGEISFSIFNHLLPTLMKSETTAFEQGMSEFKSGLCVGDVERGLWGARRLMSKAEWGSKAYKGAAPEERATLLFTYLCYSAPFRVVCEPKQAYGTPDRVVEAGDYIYVMKFKRASEGGINKSWRQVRERRYVEAYVGEATEWGAPKTVVAVVVVVREDGKALIDWQAKRYDVRDGHLLVGKVLKSSPRWRELEGSGAEGRG